MTDVRNKRSDGVRHLEDLRVRCFIDPETGCWLWRMAFARSKTRKIGPTTRVWLPDGLRGDGKPAITTAGKAAWLLSGRKLADGQVVWRAVCGQADCINPQHGKAMTRPEMHAAIAASGRLKGDPHRAAINTINRAAGLLPRETVSRAEAMFAEGKLQREVVAELRIGHDAASRIRRGLHPHCTNAAMLVRGASVFTLGASA